jgi:acetyl-CoA C-acetyltransferase
LDILASDMGEFCEVSKDGHVWTVTINRPEVMNALHPPANAEVAEVWDAFASDAEAWVGIITGAGDRAFSAGNDLKYQAAGGDMTAQPPSGFAGLTSRFDLDKPVIAAVNGVAMGGGFEIALACDIIVASDQATFALPEPRVGLAALAGGMQRLPRMIPLKQAMGMILTGRRVPAAEGFQMGFVTEVVSHGELMDAARRWADQILECSPVSVRTSKQVVMRSLDVAGLAESMDLSMYPAIGDLFRSDDFREGPLAFAQKRKPEWKGK